MPVTIPDEAPTVVIVKLLLLQLPPVVASFKVIVEPWQKAMLPVIAAGKGLTVMVRVIMQPVGAVYVMFVVPAATPLTIPLETPTVAAAVLLLPQVPPAMVLVSVEVAPIHTEAGPPIVGGIGFTVTTEIV
jgi:hypothetical protein